MVVGFAASDTVGGGSMVTVAVALAEPPTPVQVSVKSVALASVPVDAVPDVPLLPDQPPDAVHEVALVVFQFSVAALPETTAEGVAVNETVGVGFTVTVVLCEALPPAPVHNRVNVVVDCSAAVAAVPDVALLPDHPPLAVQLVALVLLQVRFDVKP
jgi:hypothetical protein